MSQDPHLWLAEQGIRVKRVSGNQVTTCPACSHTRKKKTDPCLSVKVEGSEAVFNCHHCGHKGGFNAERERERLAEGKGCKPRYRNDSRGLKSAKEWW